MSDLEILNDFHLKVEIAIPWVDMDIYGHVNNANYFRYFETSRVKYLEETGIYGYYETHGWAGVLSRASCHFLIPVSYPDVITVGARVTEIGRDTIAMEHFITSPKSGLCAFGESEIVLFDFRLGKKMDVPGFVKEAIEKFENTSF